MSNDGLFNNLISSGVLKTPEIIQAFGKVDRADFVPEALKELAYGDFPLSIGEGQTISQPWSVAFMLELLQPQFGQKVLDVGSGSGWTTALLAHIIGSKGMVTGIEKLPALVEQGRSNLRKYSFPWSEIVQAETSLGWEEEAPYDRILVSAAARELPEELIDQLKIGGILVIPVKNSVWKVTKESAENNKKEEYPGFIFLPLV